MHSSECVCVCVCVCAQLCSRRWPLRLETRWERSQGGVNLGCTGRDSAPPSAGDLRELPRVPLRGEGSCGGFGAPRDSAGSGMMKGRLEGGNS